MKTGFGGTSVIRWAQTEIDALTAPPVGAIAAGATWRWTGTAFHIAPPQGGLNLEAAGGIDDLHRRAAANLRQMFGHQAVADQQGPTVPDDTSAHEAGFDVTDGNRSYRVIMIRGTGADPLVVFAGETPPPDTDFWIVRTRLSRLQTAAAPGAQGTVCFTPGTRIATPAGPRPVEELEEGDWVSTRDDGDQRVLWIGRRQVSGARMQAMPHLRPVRICAHVLGQHEPDADLVVSPDHRILLRGSMARTLFNTDEVLVAARDLLNDSSILIDHKLRAVTYIHLLLPSHQIIRANGIEAESFHPGLAALDEIEDVQRRRLFDCLPELRGDPAAYGMPVRRALNSAEASLLRHHAGQRGC